MILGIYGSGGLGRAVLDLAQSINAIERNWEKIVFINDFGQESIGSNIEMYSLVEFQIRFPINNTKVVIATGEPKYRHMLREKVTAHGFRLQTIVHSTASIGSETQIGDGTIIQFGCFIEYGANIGINALILQNSSVGHDSIVGSDAVVSPCCFIAGACKVGDRAYIAACVPVKEKTTIGADSIVGMGSVVLRDIPENVVALGNPARAMKNNENGLVFK